MARQEHNREDLVAEATALARRARLRLGGGPPIVAGFRRDGAASFYFDDGSAYHFNAAGQLRRAFHADLLLKAESGRLVALRRQRAADRVELVSRNFGPEETQALLSALEQQFSELKRSLIDGLAEVEQQIPPQGDFRGELLRWLDQHAATIAIAARPHAH